MTAVYWNDKKCKFVTFDLFGQTIERIRKEKLVFIGWL